MADWDRDEVEAAVSDYLHMLTLELRGQPYNKSSHRRNLRAQLQSRTDGSVERKHQNISAVLNQLGFPSITGYKPLSNFQKSLLPDVVSELVDRDLELQGLIAEIVQAPPVPDAARLFDAEVEAPRPDLDRGYRANESRKERAVKPTKRNFLEIETRDRELGFAGEKLVLEFEHQRLWGVGAKGLAEKVEHVSVTQGDGLGFDILSFEPDGRERLIEVKTTNFGIFTPFYATRNEVEVSEKQREHFQLYRLHEFRKSPRIYRLEGSLRNTCRLEPALFVAKVA